MKNISTEHQSECCPMCLAIDQAREAVLASRKEESAIPVILRALGWEKSPKPWPAAVKALKDHALSMALTAELSAHLELVSRHDAWLAEYDRHMQLVSEPNSQARRKMQRILVEREQQYQQELRKLEQLKEAAGITGKVSDHLKTIESKGLMDLLGLKASELTAAKQAAKKPFKMIPDIKLEIRKATALDIVAEYNLSREDIPVAELIAYLRNLSKPKMLSVKRHSKPRKRIAVDEGTLKEEVFHATKEYREQAAARFYKGKQRLIKVA